MSGRLERLLRPRSLAFVGGTAAELAIDASRSLGFAGDMWAINPQRRLRDLPTFASVSALPGAPDAAFVGVDGEATVEVVRQLAEIGAGAAVCYASGFAETGEAGAQRQIRLLEAARGVPVVGPNCYGALSAVTGAALWPDVHGLTRRDRGVALLSQSGNLAVNLTMQRRGLDIAYVMALGNQADVGLGEALETMVADPDVSAIGLVVEAIDDVERFAAAANLARARNLPVVALKLGASAASRAIAVTHTASLVGSDAAYEALFKRLGVCRVNTVSELLDTLGVLLRLAPLRGNRVVSLSCSGGEAALVADRGVGTDVVFCDFAPDHRSHVEQAFDGRVAVSNPLDYHTFIWGDKIRLRECFDAVLGAAREAEPPFDAALLVLDFPAVGLDRSRWWPTLEAFGEACQAARTPGVVAASMAENLPEDARSRAAELGLASCGDIDDALSALEAAAAFSRPFAGSAATAMQRPSGAADGVDAAESRLASAATDSADPADSPSAPGVAVLAESEAKRRLARAGVRVPESRVVPASQAGSAACKIGFPVVVKTTDAAHKSDFGGVHIGLANLEQVTEALTRMAATTAMHRDATSDTTPAEASVVLVESHIAGAVAELLVNVRVEPPVGTLLTIGAGGTLAELLDDTVCLLVPAAPGEILQALRCLRVWPLLTGHRGQPAAAVEEIVSAIDAMARLVDHNESIIEVEVNPLLALPDAAVAVDALMLVADRCGEDQALEGCGIAGSPDGADTLGAVGGSLERDDSGSADSRRGYA